jgi:hypothetical protein
MIYVSRYIVPVVLCLLAGYMAINHIWGWGWFFAGSLLTYSISVKDEQ